MWVGEECFSGWSLVQEPQLDRLGIGSSQQAQSRSFPGGGVWPAALVISGGTPYLYAQDQTVHKLVRYTLGQNLSPVKYEECAISDVEYPWVTDVGVLPLGMGWRALTGNTSDSIGNEVKEWQSVDGLA